MDGSGTRLSAPERAFIEDGVRKGVRVDGRGCRGYRPVSVAVGILPQCNGSAKVTIYHANTEVIAAVKAEIGDPSPDHPDEGRIECSVECSLSASLGFAGRGADQVNADLTAALRRVLVESSALDLKPLCLEAGKLCWVLNVDVVVMDASGGISDAISLAAHAAVSSTRLPKLRVIPSDRPGESEILLDSDPDATEALTDKCSAQDLPIAVTCAQIGSRAVVDATAAESACASARVAVSVDRRGRVCGLDTEVAGGEPVEAEVLAQAIEAGRAVGPALFQAVDQAVAGAAGAAAGAEEEEQGGPQADAEA